MKVRNSLKSLRGRHRNNRLVRRKGRVYVINKVQRRFKARQVDPAPRAAAESLRPHGSLTLLLLAARFCASRLWKCD